MLAVKAMGARSLERMNQPRGIVELQAGFSSHQCAKHPIVWSRVPPNTEVSKRLASWKSLTFNGDTSNEPLVLASKAKNFPLLLCGITTSPRPRKALDRLDKALRWVALCCFFPLGGSLVESGLMACAWQSPLLARSRHCDRTWRCQLLTPSGHLKRLGREAPRQRRQHLSVWCRLPGPSLKSCEGAEHKQPDPPLVTASSPSATPRVRLRDCDIV
jgi:hypothetical protein